MPTYGQAARLAPGEKTIKILEVVVDVFPLEGVQGNRLVKQLATLVPDAPPVAETMLEAAE